MLARLGSIIYWTASAVAALLAGAAIPAAARETSTFGAWAVVAFFLGFALLAWLLGRAARYVLAGR